ncbi:hypothetical protein Tco_0463217 [Tanacetum coccineum]
MVISSPCLTDIKNWLLASPKQTALSKDISNPLIVDSLLKTVWLSMHHVITMKHWLFQSKQLLGRIVGIQKSLQLIAAVVVSNVSEDLVLLIKIVENRLSEYDIWAMKMEHYLSHTDYPIWEVIQKGNGLPKKEKEKQGPPCLWLYQKTILDAFDDLDVDGRDYMETKDVVKEGRQSNETEVFNKGNGKKGGSTKGPVSTAISKTVSIARHELSTARPDVDAARKEDSAVEPRTPPTTTGIFYDEDITMAQTLIKMKEEKAKEKGVSIKDVEDYSRPARSTLTLKKLLTIDPKDKGKSVLEEPEPAKKMTRSDFDAAQIARDVEIARQLQVDLQAEVKRERQREEEASKAAIAEIYDEVQEGIDADALFAAKLQPEEREEYIIEERAKFLAETIASQRKFKAA